MTRVDKKHIEKRAESVFVRVIIDGFFSKIFFFKLSDYALNKLLKTKTRNQWQKKHLVWKKKKREKNSEAAKCLKWFY